MLECDVVLKEINYNGEHEMLPIDFKTFKSINIKHSNYVFRIWVLADWIIDLID